MNNLRTYLSVLVLMCLVTQLHAEQTVDLFSGPRIMTDTTDVVELAAAFCGFSVLEDNDKMLASAKSEIITYVDTTTPFIADKLNGRKAYRVRFKNVIMVRLENSQIDPKNHPLQFEVYIDSITGGLLKIHITVEGLKDSEPSRIPYWEDATNWMKRGDMAIHNLSTEIPSTTLLEVFKVVRDHPLLAKEIVCFCAWESHLDKGTFLWWDIHFYGLPPRIGRSPYSAPNKGLPTHTRNVVDATSGRFVFRTN